MEKCNSQKTKYIFQFYITIIRACGKSFLKKNIFLEYKTLGMYFNVSNGISSLENNRILYSVLRKHWRSENTEEENFYSVLRKHWRSDLKERWNLHSGGRDELQSIQFPPRAQCVNLADKEEVTATFRERNKGPNISVPEQRVSWKERARLLNCTGGITDLEIAVELNKAAPPHRPPLLSLSLSLVLSALIARQLSWRDHASAFASTRAKPATRWKGFVFQEKKERPRLVAGQVWEYVLCRQYIGL